MLIVTRGTHTFREHHPPKDTAANFSKMPRSMFRDEGAILIAARKPSCDAISHTNLSEFIDRAEMEAPVSHNYPVPSS